MTCPFGWVPDDLNPGPECPYCEGMMCARFDGLCCTHSTKERHGYPPSHKAAPDPEHEGFCAVCGNPVIRATKPGARDRRIARAGKYGNPFYLSPEDYTWRHRPLYKSPSRWGY